MEKAAIKYRFIRFCYWFGSGCLVMVAIRLQTLGQLNPVGDQAATYGLITGLTSLLVGFFAHRWL